MEPLKVREKAGCRWDIVSLGEVMLRLDPGEGRIHTTRSLIPTGGVSVKTAAEFIRAGAFALGVGADLVDNAAVREGRAASVTEKARESVRIVREARQGA